MSWLQCLLGNGNNLLQLWKKYEVHAESNGVRPEQPWRHLNPWIRDQEQQKPWSQARSFWKTTNRCTTRRNGCSRRPDRKSTEAIRRYFHDGTERPQKVIDRQKGEENTTSYCTTESPWRSTSTSPQKLRELTIRSIGFSRKMQKEELSLHSINEPTLLKQKRECKRLQDEHLARTQEKKRTIPRSQQIRQRKGQQFEGNAEYDHAVDPKTGWRFCRQSRGNLQTTSSGSRANMQEVLSSSSTWDQTHGKTSSWKSQHSPSPDDWWFFSDSGQVSVAWRKTSSQPTGRREEGVNSAPTNTARTELHSAWSHFITRTRVAQA